jgi:hypothetical protein
MIWFSHLTALAIVVSSLAARQPDFEIDALPIGPAQWHIDYFPVGLRAELDKALQLPAADVRALLASDDPRDRGIGIFVASFNGDLDTLFAAAPLLDDTRQAIPVGLGDPSAIWIDGTIALIHEPRTVGGYLKAQYNVWLGLPAFLSVQEVQDEVRRVARDGTAPDHAHYWATRHALAPDAQARSAVMQEIFRLPESIRWAVAVEIASRHSESGNDARSLARTIGSGTSDLIRAREIKLPPDLIYLHEANREKLFLSYDALTRSP